MRRNYVFNFYVRAPPNTKFYDYKSVLGIFNKRNHLCPANLFALIVYDTRRVINGSIIVFKFTMNRNTSHSYTAEPY